VTSETQDDKKRADYLTFTVSELAIEIHDSMIGFDALRTEADALHDKADALSVEAYDLRTRARECATQLVTLLASKHGLDFATVWSAVKDQIFDDNTD
jgi:hypothetical protein